MYVVAHLLKMLSVIMSVFALLLIGRYMGGLSSQQQACVGYIISLPVILAIYAIFPKGDTKKRDASYSRVRYVLYTARIMLSIVAKYYWFEGLRYIGQVNLVSILYIIPILSIIMSMVIFGEKLRYYWVMPFLIAVLGVVIIVGVDVMGKGSTIGIYGFISAILSAICYSICNIIYRKQAQHEHYVLQLLYTSVANAMIFLMLVYMSNGGDFFKILLDSYVTVYNVKLLYIVSVIFTLTTLSALLNFISYSFATVAELAIHDYLRIVLIIASAYIFADTIPHSLSIIGVILILIGNFLVLGRR